MTTTSCVDWLVEKGVDLFYVYHLLDDDDNVIYVGMSVNPNARLTQHRKTKPEVARMVVIQSHKTSRDCAEAEIHEISRLLPRLNVLERDRHARQMAGIAKAKERGIYTGRSWAMSDEQVAEARKLVELGVPKAKVARQFDVSRQTLHSSLANR